MDTTLSPMPQRSFRNTQLWKKFLAKMEETPDGCWNWTGSRNNKGYGQHTILAHRLAYEMFVGPIPDDLGLDHACVNPPCVNPTHLRPMSQADNCARNRRTHCKHGHPLTPDNIYFHRRKSRKSPSRECRICAIRTAVKATRRYRAKKRLSQGEIVKNTWP